MGKDHDGSWKDVYWNVEEEPHPCSISKHEFDELFVLPTEELDTEFDEDAIEESKIKRLRHTISLLEKTQQHNSHKPHPFGPPLEGQNCSRKKPKVSSPEEAPCYCAKGYPKPLRPSQSEDIQKDPYREKLYKLSLERNDQTVNNYNAPILLALGANMDIQAVCTYDGLLRYICKYVTKDNSMDIFRDFRDDSGKPTDPPLQHQASHQIPVNNMVTRLFMNLLKFSFISESELSHHALGLPAHFCSRTFCRINLQSELKRLFRPDEACGEEILVKQDELSTYERRNELTIPTVSRAKGVTEEALKEMSLFYFNRKFYARLNTLCQKKKASIVIFRPYVSPKRENNPEFEKYMLLTLLAYKAFQIRTEFTSLEQDELLETFNEFIDSDLCPYFVKTAYKKANQTRKINHAMPVRNNQVNNTQDEIDEAINLNTPDEDSAIGMELDTIPVPEDDNQVPSSEASAESENDEEVPRRRPLATFTRDFQDLGHMGKGLSLDALNLECYDDDNDVQQEINILSHEIDLVFDRTKHSWTSLYPDLSQSIEPARLILKEKPHIDHSATKYDPKDLDPTQTFMLNLVLDWAKQCIACKIDKKPFPPFKAKLEQELESKAGTGKSRTVKTIMQEFNYLMKNSSLPPNERGEIKICAPTGVAAFNLGCGAGTIHSTFDIRVKEKINDVAGERQKKLEECFENVWLIIIDEISMVGSDLFAKIDIRLNQAKLDENRILEKFSDNQNILNQDFGGLGIIVSGDMAQLPPIQAKSMMDPSLGNPSKEYERLCNKGRELFDRCNVTVVLTKQHRQAGGEYTNLCLKFRDGTFTPKDHLLLQSRNFEDLPLDEKIHFETYGTRLVSTNEAAGKYNATRMTTIAKQTKQKIFRIQAQETGCLGQPLESSDKFGGLKSKIHLTIGSRVMLSNNLWIEAGLINGAQGIVVDVAFHDEEKEEDAVPKYVIVKFDEYGGPPFFDNRQCYNWVSIFPISRRHQNNSKMERTGIPLRSSWYMTGFKVQGLNLYNGAVNDYPNLNNCKKRTKDPMGTWGLNYCMLTRVPDISKITLINLPDYQRHMKLYQNNPKKRGKNFFKMFLDFDKKSFVEFGKLFNFCTGFALKDLSNATQNFSLNSPVDFQLISKEEWKSNLKIDFQPSFNNYFSTSKRNLQRKIDMSKPSSSTVDKDFNPTNRMIFQPKSTNVSISQTSNLINSFPRFLNTSGTDCWLNSVLQLLILAMKHKPESVIVNQIQAFITAPENIICNSISNFVSNPSTYSVASITDKVLAPYSCQLSLKKIMLVAMGMPSSQELSKQQDAAECLTRILNMPPFSYLSSFYKIKTRCGNCNDGNIVREKIPIFITDLKIECDTNGMNKHSGKDDIECLFKNPVVFQRDCGKCGAIEGNQMIKPESEPDFVMVNFNLFKSDMTKINVESYPFDSVEISTDQGASVYNVIGSIEHLGGNIHHGHYVSYIKLGQSWFCCNDSAITQLDDYLTATRKPYIVFLKKD